MIVSSSALASNRGWLYAHTVAPAFQGAKKQAPGMLRPARRCDVEMDVAGQQTEHEHRREVTDRIGAVRMQHELGLRRRSRREVEQHRIVGIGFRVGRERRRRVQEIVVAMPARRRVADRDPGQLLLEARRTSRCRPPAVTTWRARPRANRSARSAGVSSVAAGMITAPSFITASIVSHSGATLPSITSTRSPRFTPSARSALARRFERSESSAKLSEVAPSPTMVSAGRAALSPRASSASNQSSAQLKWVGSGQRKSRHAAS